MTNSLPWLSHGPWIKQCQKRTTHVPGNGLYIPPIKMVMTSWGMVPSGKRLHNYGKIHHAINGKIHYFYGHFQ